MKNDQWQQLETALQHGLARFRWFGAKSRTITQVKIFQKMELPAKGTAQPYSIALARIEYDQGTSEIYALPVAFANGKPAARLLKTDRASVFWVGKNGEIAYDATLDAAFRSQVIQFIFTENSYKTGNAQFKAAVTSLAHGKVQKFAKRTPASRVLKAEQSNTSLVYGSKFVLKFYRRLSEGVNPDVEIGRFLTDETSFRHSPAVIGTIEFDPRQKNHEPITIGCVYEFVRNQGDAWKIFLMELKKLSKSASTRKPERLTKLAAPRFGLIEAARHPIPAPVKKEFGKLLTYAGQLGRRTYEMHAALASRSSPSEFKLEKLSPAAAAAFSKDLQRHSDLAFHVLRGSISKLSGSVRKDSIRLLEMRRAVLGKFTTLTKSLKGTTVSRTHGDYHLGQVLFTGSDFIIIDYEGEPARPLAERRRKHPPFRDVAGMLRSFSYAAQVARDQSGPHADRLGIWFSLWSQWTSVAYLRGYLENAGSGPENDKITSDLIQIYLLEKALYELVYELNNRPDWVKVPLSGILEILEA
ncbi:MAG TPA: hypothetical protein DCS07_01220 [Bdellovibrionales bacterium]|nr:MAG: hypothetical protein A2Z97_01550 [Bdellovibrionales bacterium GWB1_52_6]OFZ05026.1 MAG: hypothetical protein A2X97_00320 [Bdellovibrionales bacterium GWA1_52_35]HAR41247.1 hypothetical protein [Bdellovibrionales bacterium]HCM41259.1 hypothetical protein [Bdellovibrionales bacterium]